MNDPTPRAGLLIRTGCDLVALAEVEQSIAQFGVRYLRRVYTPNELRYCDGPDRVARLAARFAAKEAVIKAFAEPSASFGFHDVEVDVVGSVPRLVLSGTAARLATEQGWVDNSVSLSHTGCHAAAVVAATCNAADDRRRRTIWPGNFGPIQVRRAKNRSVRDGREGR